MMIHIDNYELYAIDYIDGSLDADAKIEMDKFLEHHPEILQELNDVSEPVAMVPNMDIVFKNKSVLRKESRKFVIGGYWKWTAAASVIIALGILAWTATSNKDILHQEELAINNDIKITEDNNLRDLNNSIIAHQEDPNVAVDKAKIEIKDASKSIKINEPPNNSFIVKRVNSTPTKNNLIALDETPSPTSNIDQTGFSTISNPTKDITRIVKLEPEQINTREPIAVLTSLKSERVPLDFEKDKTTLPLNLIADYKAEAREDKKKHSWFINAITKKADGSNVFAFDGVKRALTPTRYRDVNVDKSSTNSPIKQLTND